MSFAYVRRKEVPTSTVKTSERLAKCAKARLLDLLVLGVLSCLHHKITLDAGLDDILPNVFVGLLVRREKRLQLPLRRLDVLSLTTAKQGALERKANLRQGK